MKQIAPEVAAEIIERRCVRRERVKDIKRAVGVSRQTIWRITKNVTMPRFPVHHVGDGANMQGSGEGQNEQSSASGMTEPCKNAADKLELSA